MSKWIKRCVLIVGVAATGLFATTLAHHQNGFLEFVMNNIEEKPWSTSMPQNFLTTYFQEIESNKQCPIIGNKPLITFKGFGYEKYKVKTEDGYILRAHRIVTNNPGGPPVIFQHGFIAASDSLVVTDRNRTLAFVLADAGFDVWLTDLRGNWYSREHVKYKPTEQRFWDFSFHEAGYYDLPAFIDTILQVTGYSQLYYIGHSMGTTVFLVMASLRPEYNQKIKVAALLAPVALSPKMQEITSPVIRLLLLNADSIHAAVNKIGIQEFLPRSAQNIMAIRTLCSAPATQNICLDLLGMAYGENRGNLDRNNVNIQLSYLPAGSSLRTAHHLAQIFKDGFRQYNYGAKDNLRQYHSQEPPYYPLQNITAPVALYWGSNDALVYRRTVNELGQMLPNLLKIYEIPDPKFTHVDFIYGLNTFEILYKDIVYLFLSFL